MPETVEPHAEPGTERAADGRGLLQALYAACRLSAMWGFGNKLTVDALDALAAAVRDAAGPHTAVSLRLANDMAFLDDRRLRVDFSGYGALRHVLERTTRQGIGEIRLPADPGPADLQPLLEILERRQDDTPDASAEAAFETARETLRRATGDRVTIAPPFDATDGGPAGDGGALRTDGVRAWLRLARAARGAHGVLTETTAAGARAFAPGACRAAVRAAVERLEAGDDTFLAATAARHVPDFEAGHAANVCVTACAVGLSIGLDAAAAGDLGMLALLHDAAAPPGGGAADRDRALSLLPWLGFTPGALRCVHAARALHGAPAGAPLFARIVRACCFLDGQTTPAGPEHPARAAHHVLAAMAEDDGSHFDAAVVRVLAEVTGRIPEGGDAAGDGPAHLRALDVPVQRS